MSIKKRLTVALTVITLLVVFAQRIEAAETSGNYRTINIYYYDLSKDENTFTSFPIDVYGSFTNEQTAYFIYANLFEHYNTDRLPFISEGVKLLSVKINNGHLIINISHEIADYGGGTSFERSLVNTIVKNAYQIDGVTKISILIEGNAYGLPEGTDIAEISVLQ